MGILYIVSTPIGNLEDITIRAIKTLFSVDIILCEDTRRTGVLLKELRQRYLSLIQQGNNGAMQQLVSYHEHNEMQKIPELIQSLSQGKHIALVSDAGTPLISDPGFLLVREAMKQKLPIISISGPSAFLSALTSSGLPAQHVLFLGYPPEKQSHRITLFSELLSCLRIWKHIRPTCIFYCAPHKLQSTLVDMQAAWGDVDIVIARELTKVHEEVWRAKLSLAQEQFKEPKGEFVIVFSLP